MSRETDSPSSGPNGRGGAAYPSGTPPYGTPVVSDGGADAGRSAAQPEERKTETTLTTRIRINIPGSRPIPPVVVRKPVADAGGKGGTGGADAQTARSAKGGGPSAEATTSGPAGGGSSTGATATASASAGAVETPAEQTPAADEKTSDWFAPRKSGGGKGGPGTGSTNGAGMQGGSAVGVGPGPAGAGAVPGADGGARQAGPGAGAGAPGGARPGTGAGRPGGVVGSMSVPGSARSGGGTNGAGLPGATGGPVAPGHGGGTGSFDVTEALAAGPMGNGARPAQGGGETRRDDLPYFTDNGGAPRSGQGLLDGPGGPGAPGGPSDFNGPDGPRGRGGAGGPQHPAGPTGGPVTGDGPVVPPVNGGAPGVHAGAAGTPQAPHAPGGPGIHGGPGGPGGPGTQGGPGGPGGYGGPGGPGGPGGAGGPSGPGGPGSHGGPTGLGGPGTHGGPGGPSGPGGPGPRNAQGGPAAVRHPGPGGGLSDDTAILTPQKPAPEPGAGGGYGRHDNVSGQTVTSGIPVVPAAGRLPGPGEPFAPTGPADGAQPHNPPKRPEPVAQNAQAADSKKNQKAKKKGRSKLVLVGALVVVGAAGAYGAGLLMNHSDVPKGTTVLGVEIGGGTRDDAVKKLGEAFDGRVNQALKLSVDGSTVTLKPDQAGLQFDMQSTVDAAAGSDYNPVSVIGSLFGEHRVVEPVMPVDEEKLQAALKTAAGGSGSATDGTIKFESGKAVAVYGKAGKGIDAAKAESAVVAAYRAQVESGAATAVKVPTTTRQPTVSDAEVDRMMKEFAEPAMSGKVTVQTDAAHSVPLSPKNSLWKFLGVKAVNGKLVEYYDKAALKELYGGAFDGVLITRGTGQKTPVSVEDVINALRVALKSETDRVGIIDTDPS
ncbi:hypothetical protein [Streptomyces sp. NPDC002328]|uniref:hypothetical protein n=1 Tax=Streptomyces sp. NPDC002328 TaxID=3364642 RepID=UPI0036B90C25